MVILADKYGLHELKDVCEKILCYMTERGYRLWAKLAPIADRYGFVKLNAVPIFISL